MTIEAAPTIPAPAPGQRAPHPDPAPAQDRATGHSGLLPMDVAGRLPALRAALDPAGCDAVMITNLVNIRYLTGFTGSAALLLVHGSGCIFATDGRYLTQSAEQLASAGVEAEFVIGRLDAQRQGVIDAANRLGVRHAQARIGLEASSVTWAQQRQFAGQWFSDSEVVPTDGLVERLRLAKDPGELSRIQAASAIADRALASVLPLLLDRPTEAEFGLALDFEMRRLGADDVSFETIVASGPNGARPHARPSARPITEGELVVLDFGALVDGYHSDMSRTVCVGEPANPTLLRMVEAVTASQAAGVAAVRAGAKAAHVDATCRRVLAEYQWEEAFLHGTGHGVGLDIHEAPGVNAVSVATLAAGQVVTVEPGVYLPEHGGVRIEDTLVVTEEGSVPLTHAPKDLIVT
jgi:Xaa-Pro aminopeptidase